MSIQLQDYKKNILFFDNDIKHVEAINEMCPLIRAIHVNEDASFTGTDMSKLTAYSDSIGLKANDNTYVKALIDTGLGEDKIAAGLTDKQIDYIKMWAQTDLPEKKIIFDWDRTITRIEGFVFTRRTKASADKLDTLFSLTVYGVKIEDMVVYACGGQERLDKLIEMMRILQESGVDVNIVTNNAACFKEFYDAENRLIENDYKTIVKAFWPLTDDKVHCSGAPIAGQVGDVDSFPDGYGRRYYRNKAEFMKVNPVFSTYCNKK